MHHSEGGSAETESGLWIDALDNWRVTGENTIPPGIEEKTPTKESDKKEYSLIRSDYLLRPEASQSVIHISRNPLILRDAFAGCRVNVRIVENNRQ